MTTILAKLVVFRTKERLAIERRRSFRPSLEALETRAVLSTAHADFNGDGADDLAIGFPEADANSGAVQIVYGRDKIGLTTLNAQYFCEDAPQADTFFGHSLAAGDFNGDGYDDLAVGMPGKDLNAELVDAGAVTIFYGSQGTGLRSEGRQLFHEGIPNENFENYPGTAHAHEAFGWSLAAGNFDGDKSGELNIDDLAVGAPVAEGHDEDFFVGAVDVFFGTHQNGLTSSRAIQLVQGDGRVPGTSELGDEFGAALAAGDFNRDGRDDLAIGVPGEGIGGTDNVGAVNIVFGSSNGLATTGNQTWTQNSSAYDFLVGHTVDILDQAEGGDQFGFALAAGDFNGDGRVDLAIGVPGENIGTSVDTGAVNVLYGSLAGLTVHANQFLHQDRSGVRGSNESGDGFGTVLAAGDFNGDGDADLAVGSPGERLSGIANAGAVIIILGEGGGLAHNGSFALSQLTDANDTTQLGEGDRFGSALAVGDFNGDGRDELAVGVPNEDVAGKTGLTQFDSGQVEVIHFDATGLAVTRATLWDWRSLGGPWGTSNRNSHHFGSSL